MVKVVDSLLYDFTVQSHLGTKMKWWGSVFFAIQKLQVKFTQVESKKVVVSLTLWNEMGQTLPNSHFIPVIKFQKAERFSWLYLCFFP